MIIKNKIITKKNVIRDKRNNLFYGFWEANKICLNCVMGQKVEIKNTWSEEGRKML